MESKFAVFVALVGLFSFASADGAIRPYAYPSFPHSLWLNDGTCPDFLFQSIGTIDSHSLCNYEYSKFEFTFFSLSLSNRVSVALVFQAHLNYTATTATYTEFAFVSKTLKVPHGLSIRANATIVVPNSCRDKFLDDTVYCVVNKASLFLPGTSFISYNEGMKVLNGSCPLDIGTVCAPERRPKYGIHTVWMGP